MQRLTKLSLMAALFAIPLAWGSSPAKAACSGGGTSWSCTAGTTSAQIGSALSSATDGATLTFDAGSYSWDSYVSFNNAKGATLICASPGACNVTAAGTVLGMNSNLSGNNNHLYRISGFNFSSNGNSVIWFYGPGTLQQLRIDHNNFTGPADTTFMLLGEMYTVTNFYGVIDHNTFSSPGSIAAYQHIGALNPTPPPSVAGTANNMFFEDNTITITTMTNAGTGCIDGWGGNATVYRHNTSSNCLVTTHGATHAGGPPNFELYNNKISVNSGASAQGFADCTRCFHHQGSGEFYAFNNTFTASGGKSGGVISMMDYRAYANSIDGGAPICDGNHTATFGDGGRDGNRAPQATYAGYPCWHQPGRDFAATPAGGNLKPMYVWNNYWSDTLAMIPLHMDDLGGSPDYVPQHEQANRDYYSAVSASAQTSPTSPFNGTTGMGFGTLANRPTTCSTNASETGGGVGYFATDQGPQGTLYRCSAANTWVVHYAPYAYPHPLVSQVKSQSPVITSALSASGTVGQAFNYQITASNSPTSFGASGLPAGLSINTANGLISGTPTAATSVQVAISATNATGTGTANLALTIGTPIAAKPAITSALSAKGVVGQAFSYQITATNTPTSFGASGLPAGLSINTATGLISGKPTAAGTSNVTLTATNASGSGTATLALTISNYYSLFSTSMTPSIVTVSDANSVELGVVFRPSSNGYINGLRFYKGPQNTGTHTGHLWNFSSGSLLASATFTNESASGWQTVTFSSPVAVTANTTYVASYHSNGYYSVNNNFFTSNVVSGPLTAPAGGNGVYAYGGYAIYPSSSYLSSNYWVDVLFSPASGYGKHPGHHDHHEHHEHHEYDENGQNGADLPSLGDE